MNNVLSTNGVFSDGFAVTPSDTVDIKNDPNNLAGVEGVFLHNVATGATVRVMPVGQKTPTGLTLTGSSGTANISINGTNYLVTFNSTLTQTATDFVTSHANTLKRLNIFVVSLGAQLRFTGPNPSTFAIANATGNLAGTEFSPTPVTIFIPQGGTSAIAVRRVYATTPTAPVGMIGYHNANK